MKYTRKQYMNHECSHREYYGQFVTNEVKYRVSVAIGKERLLASTDEHLNDIPLKVWDNLGSAGWKQAWEDAGDCPTLAGFVCIHKEAARQIMEAA